MILPPSALTGNCRTSPSINQSINQSVIFITFDLKVQEMESEAKRAPPRYRMDMMTTVRDCKKDLDRFSREMVSVKPVHC